MPRKSPTLPPLAFTDAEADTLLLGLSLVIAQGDEELAEVATDAADKIEAALPKPPELRAAQPTGATATRAKDIQAVLASAIAAERKLRLSYADKKGDATERVVWPISTELFEYAHALTAWCEMRGDFRNFRLDRIAAATPIADPMPRRRRALLAEWRARGLDAY